MASRLAVSSADFIRNIGYWQNEALRRPVGITHHGRERLILSAPEEFESRHGAESAPQIVAELEAERARVAAIAEGMEEGYLVLDVRLRVTESNPIAQAFFTRSALNIKGASVLDLFPQPIASILNDRLLTVRRARKVEQFEAAAFDGRSLAVKVLPVADGAIVLFRNTTEERGLRHSFEEHDAVRKATSNHPLVVAFRIDTRARLEWIDEKFGALTGFVPADLA